MFVDSQTELAEFRILDESLKVGVDEADDLLGFILLKVSHNELDIVQLGLTIHDDHIRCNTDLVILVNVFKEWHQERDHLGVRQKEEDKCWNRSVVQKCWLPATSAAILPATWSLAPHSI